MKIIISESQYELLAENKFKEGLEEYMDLYDNDVNSASESSGIELYKFIEMGLIGDYDGYLDLAGTPIKSLGNLKSVSGSMDLGNTQIEDLGNLTSVENDLYLNSTSIKDLGKLKSVGGDLYLNNCEKLTDLGNLKSVGGYLYLRNTPISRMMSKYYIKKKIKVRGDISI